MPRLEYTEHTTDEPIWINTSSKLAYTIQTVWEALSVYFQKTIINQWRINIYLIVPEFNKRKKRFVRFQRIQASLEGLVLSVNINSQSLFQAQLSKKHALLGVPLSGFKRIESYVYPFEVTACARLKRC